MAARLQNANVTSTAVHARLLISSRIVKALFSVLSNSRGVKIPHVRGTVTLIGDEISFMEILQLLGIRLSSSAARRSASF